MITIRKNSEPVSLTHFRANGGRRFDDLDSKAKEDLRNSLLAEQGYICAYCMKRIGRDKNGDGYIHDVKIEHVIPRSETRKHPDTEFMELDYGNLVAVCNGMTNSIKHCDTSKGNNLISFSPSHSGIEETIKYGLKDGSISSSNRVWNDDLNGTNKLNLNHPTLKLNRIAALYGLQKALEKKTKWNRSSLERWMRKLDEETVKTEYIGILKYYLSKKLTQK